MPNAQIAIIGAGLSGLYAAYTLQKEGVTDTVVLEAREVLGGRIVSASLPATIDAGALSQGNAPERFDLGPSWFWPGYQQQLDRVTQELGLRRYEQYEDGDTLVERSPDWPPARTPGYVNSPPSMRLEGGMGSLIEALYRHLDPARIHTGQIVRKVTRTPHGVDVESTDRSGRTTTWNVDQVMLAMPPRLAQTSITFSPDLPVQLSHSWGTTATWMAPHAKYFAVFETPFWREQGLSGEGRSSVGPLVEIHDASPLHGRGALFGFLGVSAAWRQTLPESDLRSLCRAQLVRMFGPQASRPVAELFKDWAADPFTATTADLTGAGQHPEPPATVADNGPWSGRLVGVGSEWSPQFPGYLAGALDAVTRGLPLVLRPTTE